MNKSIQIRRVVKPINYVVKTLQSKRYHVKVKDDGKKYNRKRDKQKPEWCENE